MDSDTGHPKISSVVSWLTLYINFAKIYPQVLHPGSVRIDLIHSWLDVVRGN